MVLRKVGLTGSSGLLGRSIVAEFSKHKIETVQFNEASERTNFESWISGELLDKRFGGVDSLVHCAALTSPVEVDYRRYFDVNVRATASIQNWCNANNVRFVFISGLSTVEPYYFEFKNNLYVKSKRQATDLVVGSLKDGDIVLKPSSIYGLGMRDDCLIRKMIRMAHVSPSKLSTMTLPLLAVNYVHARDVARSIHFALKNKLDGAFCIFGAGMISFEDIRNLLCVAKNSGSVPPASFSSDTLRRRFDPRQLPSSEVVLPNWFPIESFSDSLSELVECELECQ